MGLSGSVVASTQWRGANFKRKAAASCVGVATNGTQKWCVTCGRGWSEMVTCARLFCVALPFGICVAEHPRMDLWICGAQNRRRYRRRRRCISSRSTCRTQLPSTRLSCMGMLTAHSHSRTTHIPRSMPGAPTKKIRRNLARVTGCVTPLR